MTELIYYVDEDDNPTGETEEKYAAHYADTKLHAAFSVYVFNDKGQLLVTQRAFSKKVWPEVWTNTCCGHPMPGESRVDAVKRRLQYELGMTADDIRLMLPKYTYKTPPYKGIIEHEFCPVYFARATSEPVPNSDEVEAYHWMDWEDFIAAAEADGPGDGGKREWMKKLPEGEYRSLGIWSWWCKDQLKQLKPLLV
jgi:isopentenyl-diphosphate delta-isomerase